MAPYVSPVVAELESTEALSRPSKNWRPLVRPHKPGGRCERQAMLPAIAAGVAGDVAGPTDFLERLGWYREMLDGHARGQRADTGAAAASLRAW